MSILTEKFLNKYKDKQPNWGFSGLGYIVYKRTYSRIKSNGEQEEWTDTITRCINGAQKLGASYTIEQAERLYDYMFNLKCNFAGRMLWQLGTEGVERYRANALLNCFFVQINEPEAFCFLFENLMLGGGVGFSVRREDIHELKKVKEDVSISHEATKDADFIVPDSREGWVHLLRKVLKAFYTKGKSFTYSTMLVRGKGEDIKGFGGTASGAGILIEGIQKIVKIFQSREGKKLRSIDVLDICNIIGSIVVAGNVRRSAQVSLGDPDDYLFIRAKRWDLGNVPNHRAMSNNCLTGETKIITSEGIKEIKNLVGKEVEILTEKGSFEKSPINSFGFSNDIYEITFKRKSSKGKTHSIFCTGQHKWFARKDTSEAYKEYLAENLPTGLTIQTRYATFPFNNRVNISSIGIQRGIIFGDGTVNNDQAIVTLCGEKVELLKFFPNANCVKEIRNDIEIGTTVRDGFPKIWKKELPSLKESKSFLLGWLSGFIATDGCVKKNQCVVTSKEKYVAEYLRDICSILGIGTSFIRQTNNVTPYSKGKIVAFYSVTLYSSTLNHRLILRKKHLNEVNFEPKTKNGSSEWSILSVEKTNKKEEVFCATVDITHKFVLNGNIVTGNSIYADDYDHISSDIWKGFKGNGEPYGFFNLPLSQKFGRLGEKIKDKCQGGNPCMEITLPSSGACNLSELYLNNIESKEELIDCAKLLYKTQKAINCLDFLHDETTLVSKRDMRIGISVTGICQSIDKLKWLDSCYKELRKFDVKHSKANNLNESIKMTTVKPSGTLSLLAGATPGIHSAYSKYYIRRIRINSNDKLLELCKEHGYKIEYIEKFDGTVDHSTSVIEFPCYAGDNVITVKDITAIEQLELLKKMQTIWADNAVSCTIYYNKKELKGIKKWLKENYKTSVKSVSFLLHKEHGFKQAPYEEIDEETYKKLAENVIPIEVNKVMGDSIDVDECSTGSCPIK